MLKKGFITVHNQNFVQILVLFLFLVFILSTATWHQYLEVVLKVGWGWVDDDDDAQESAVREHRPTALQPPSAPSGLVWHLSQ